MGILKIFYISTSQSSFLFHKFISQYYILLVDILNSVSEVEEEWDIDIAES